MKNFNSKKYMAFKYLIFVFIFIFLCFPLYWILSTAFRTDAEIMRTELSIFPTTFTMQHFIDAVVEANILSALLNSLIIASITVLVSVSFGLLMAYVFARKNFAGKAAFNGAILFTQFIPMVAYIIPLYLMMSSLKLLNTPFALCIVYMGLTLPVSVIMLTNYVRDVPIELEEAAEIDGCNGFMKWSRIVLPLSLPGIVTTAIYVFITVWQEYLVAVSFVSKKESYTVSMALTVFQDSHGTDWGGIMAGAVIISIPVIVLFLLCRKTFTDSLSGSVKG